MNVGEETFDKGASHPLAEVDGVPEEALAFFRERWIETLEEGVASLSSVDWSPPWGKDFLALAKSVLGDDEFLRCSTPVPERETGCVLSEEPSDGADAGEKNAEEAPHVDEE